MPFASRSLSRLAESVRYATTRYERAHVGCTMPSLPLANCSSGKSACLVNTNSASVKNGPQALVREGNKHNVEMIRTEATTAFQKVLRVIGLDFSAQDRTASRSVYNNKSIARNQIKDHQDLGQHVSLKARLTNL